MGHPNVDVDVESLQKSDRRRWSCMDVFVIMSIIFLFVAMAVIAFVIVNVVMKPCELKKGTVTEDLPSLSYKVEKGSSFFFKKKKMISSSVVKFDPCLLRI